MESDGDLSLGSSRSVLSRFTPENALVRSLLRVGTAGAGENVDDDGGGGGGGGGDVMGGSIDVADVVSSVRWSRVTGKRTADDGDARGRCSATSEEDTADDDNDDDGDDDDDGDGDSLRITSASSAGGRGHFDSAVSDGSGYSGSHHGGGGGGGGGEYGAGADEAGLGFDTRGIKLRAAARRGVSDNQVCFRG